MWFGATPEQLIKVNKNSIMTVALAGTQLVSKTETVVWGEKEKKEQQLVTNYITANIQDLTKELKVSNPYNFKAGDLWHIKTDIFALLKSKSVFASSMRRISIESIVFTLMSCESVL